MKNIPEILDEVAKGKMSTGEARRVIEKHYRTQPSKGVRAERTDAEGSDPVTEARESFKSAFEKLRKTVNVDELLKLSSGVVQQIAETMPNQFERIQENIAQYGVGFSPQKAGVDSKLSVFRTFHVSDDSVVEENQVVGSQWFGVSFIDAAEVRNNKFTAVQISEMALVRSNFTSTLLALSRFSNVTMQESRYESNKLSRTIFSDVSITESDFTFNKLSNAAFARAVINASRLSGNVFNSVDIRDCEFDACDIQGIEFSGCTFHDCSFADIVVVAKEPVKISNQSLSGRTIQGCRTVEDLLAAFESAEDISPAVSAEVEQEEYVPAPTEEIQEQAPERKERGGRSRKSQRSQRPRLNEERS